MANKIYPLWKEAVMQASTNSSLGGTVKAILIDTASYTYSDTHQFLSDVASGARTATSSALAGKTYTSGVFDATDITWSSVSGNQSEAIVLYIDTGVEGASRLVAYIDTSISGIPVTPNGGDINCAWDNGSNKIFAL